MKLLHTPIGRPQRRAIQAVIAALLLASTAAVSSAALAQASGSFSLPLQAKTAEFNVPLNFNNLPPSHFQKIQVMCEVHSSATPPTNDSNAPLAAGSETLNLVNGGYNGTVKIAFTVSPADVPKVKSWRCRTFGSGPTFSQFNLDLWFNLPDAARPANGTTTKTSASGKYD
jgi:hypothetical protein